MEAPPQAVAGLEKFVVDKKDGFAVVGKALLPLVFVAGNERIAKAGTPVMESCGL